MKLKHKTDATITKSSEVAMIQWPELLPFFLDAAAFFLPALDAALAARLELFFSAMIDLLMPTDSE